MPSISGPSMTSSPFSYFWRASSASASMNSTSPCSTAYARRSSTVPSRQARSTSRLAPAPGACLGKATTRPGGVALPLAAGAGDVLGEVDETLGGVGPAVEDDVLDQLQQVLGDVL